MTDQYPDSSIQTPEISVNYLGKPTRRMTSFGKRVKLFMGSFLIVGVAAMSLFATYYALPQTQQIGSKAQSIASKTSFSFVPLIIRPDLSTQTQAQSRLMIRKSGMQSISTISIEFTYDTKKIKNLTLEPIEWARGKPPIVLKPFSTTLSGTTATASITLGAPCDEKQCYPLKRRNNGIAKLLFSPTGNAIIAPLAQSVVTLTGISENTYDHRLSRNLTVLPQQ